MNEGIVHVFGCGHSHMLGEEVFYRAGGLAPVRVIFHEPAMLHEGAVTSSAIERKNDYAVTFMKEEDIRPTDVVIVVSTSGKNPVPIDVALYAKQQGADVIGIGSSNAGNVTIESGSVLSLTGSTNSVIDFPSFDVATSGNVTTYGSIGIDVDSSANNVLNTSSGSLAGSSLYWGNDLLCDPSLDNCGWQTAASNNDYWGSANGVL